MKYLYFLFLTMTSTSCEETSRSDSVMDQSLVGVGVTNISTSGSENSFTFSVTISSPDTGCEQYADWWEVVSESGELLYRRILLHSHVNEQPFTRSGGTINIIEDQTVWIRAHMNNKGYLGQAMKGSVKNGFDINAFPENLGIGLDQIDPLPNGCAF